MNRFDYTRIPPHMMESLRAYVEIHRPVGGFLTALLSNDLMEACGRADDTNLWLLPVYTAWLYNEAPGLCHGSPEIVKAWITRGHAKAAAEQGEEG